jgi:hypothetical protein
MAMAIPFGWMDMDMNEKCGYDLMVYDNLCMNVKMGG